MSKKGRYYGYTLIEIMVTLVIVTILSSLASVQYFRMAEKSRQAEAIEVLTRVFRGYKILVADELLNIDPASSSHYQYLPPSKRRLTNMTAGTWDPNIAGPTWVWGVLGFEDNPNNNAALDFAYDFLPQGITSGQAGCGGAGGFGSFLSSPHNVAVARRKDSAGNPTCDRYIYIDCDNGTIGKSSTYQ